MRVVIFDKNPGVGLNQWFLMASWAVGCFLQKLFGKVDAYYGATSWEDALSWISSQPGTLSSIQYWGHGSPGAVWLAGARLPLDRFVSIVRPKVTTASILWWRTCSTFQGSSGHHVSRLLANGLNCTVAAHTRIIGPLQGGLHTRKPNTEPSWPVTEGELPPSWIPSHLRWGPNTVTCFATEIPEGW